MTHDASQHDGDVHRPACPQSSTGGQSGGCPGKFNRRALLIGGAAAAAAGVVGYPIAKRLLAERQSVFLAANQSYSTDLAATIETGLVEVGFDFAWVRGRRVLLKPNMVEPSRDVPHMTTHPAMIVAAADVFLRHGAKVTIGEAPGHVRDTEMALAESGVGEALRSERLAFADMNYQDVKLSINRGRHSGLDHFFFPQAVAETDLVVSMPKLKTHHWVGMTASMKNLYGTLPGIKYGWPKNVLHYNGIPQTVVDINASCGRTIGIVDGIECMEGDGPIMGSRKHLGLVAVGTNLPALDATLARVMGLDPTRINYLQFASEGLGPIEDWQIDQRGERWQKVASPFEILDLDFLQYLRADGALVT
ncbi:MAG: DUF362 domain-containing protein [Pirellulales bacterium]|nr:DUF362 domain-containing protein [Pirellulales bacterium]